jgi:predicted ATPase
VTSERAVSVYFGGDGFKRLLLVAFNPAAFAGRQVLLEEPECFQHPSYLGRLAALIWEAIGQGTQVIMSTHSLELLNHIFLAEGVPLEKSAIFHTSLANGELRAVRIPGENTAERLEELGEDLRQ